MHADRLTKLADYLETVVAKLPPESFSLDTWGANAPECGTVCCAVGHGCSIPEFKAAGLSLAWHGDDGAEPEFAELAGWPAVAAFFGISRIHAHYLFAPPSDETTRTPLQVAARIRTFVAAGGLPSPFTILPGATAPAPAVPTNGVTATCTP